MTEYTNNTNMWSYIVEIYEWNDSSMKYTLKSDGCLTVYETGKFAIADANTKTELVAGSFKDNSAYVLSNVKTIGSTFDVEIVTRNNGKFGIRFDSSSSSSHKSFMKTYEKVKTSSVVVTCCENGNIKIEGPQTNGVYDGMCVEYYDNLAHSVKYVGEFEDNEYDGSGEFFSECGIIRIIVNNICSGNPNGIGKLFIAGNHIENINFSSIEGLDSKSQSYCEDVLRAVRSQDHSNIIEKGRFDLMGMDDKLNYLFKELSSLKLNDREHIEKKIGWLF
jgi:hypothetical protein